MHKHNRSLKEKIRTKSYALFFKTVLGGFELFIYAKATKAGFCGIKEYPNGLVCLIVKCVFQN